MQREVFTSRGSKTGMTFQAASENKVTRSSQKEISKVPSEPARPKHDPLVEQQFYTLFVNKKITILPEPQFS